MKQQCGSWLNSQLEVAFLRGFLCGYKITQMVHDFFFSFPCTRVPLESFDLEFV